MSRKYPTVQHLVENFRESFREALMIPVDKLGPIKRELVRAGEVLPIDMRHFDVTLIDGRVYCVRVSDITPEKEPA